MIGLFDSGFGGLSIMKEVTKLMPEYDYLFLGDNARAPYGNRSQQTLITFLEESIDFLFAQGCPLIILACNTASELTVRHLQEKYLRSKNITDKKILGVILPQAEKAAEITKNNSIAVVGTRATINSQTFPNEITKINPAAKVSSQACPLLVPLVEEGWHEKPEARMILKKYLRPLKSSHVDTLVLGCTHFPFMVKDFQRIMGKNVKIVHPGETVAQSLKDYLSRHPEIEKQLTRNKKRLFYTTDDTKRFQEIGSRLLGEKIEKVEHVTL